MYSGETASFCPVERRKREDSSNRIESSKSGSCRCQSGSVLPTFLFSTALQVEALRRSRLSGLCQKNALFITSSLKPSLTGNLRRRAAYLEPRGSREGDRRLPTGRAVLPGSEAMRTAAGVLSEDGIDKLQKGQVCLVRSPARKSPFI
jgi:hypothetical protein